jgi:glutamyl-tRNA synthetase
MNRVPVTLSGKGVPTEPVMKDVACHKKNPDLGFKKVWYSDQIFVEQEDALTFKPDEEVVSS